MSRFANQPGIKSARSVSRQQVVNQAGGVGYALSARSKLITLLVSSFLTDQFYRTASEQLTELKALVKQLVEAGDGLFVAQAAVLARTKFGTRSITHAAAGEVARLVKGQSWTRRFYAAVCHRPDDVLEILGYYMTQYPKAPIPNSLRRGLAAKLSTLKEHQLAKYAKSGSALSMVDAVNLLHPKSTPALAKLMTGKLAPAETWETGLTQAGQQAEGEDDKKALKAEVWERLVRERKLGYFALLRNLRNIMAQAPTVLDEALAMLVDPELVKKSLVYPFRFVTAMENIPAGPGTNKVTRALSQAVELSLSNVPQLAGDGVVVLDVSGSMRGHHKIASLFAAALVKRNGFDCVFFDTVGRYHSLNPDAPLVTMAESIPFNGGGTNFNSILACLGAKAYRHVVIISDMQGWSQDANFRARFQAYRKAARSAGTAPILYSLDMTGQGSLKVPEAETFLLAGFNDKVFDVMAALEGDDKAFESAVLAVEI